MKNPQIELVKKWLDEPKSVSAEELKRAADAAYTAYAAATTADTFADAKYWIEKYEELTRNEEPPHRTS